MAAATRSKKSKRMSPSVPDEMIQLYRCEQLSAWITLRHCEVNYEREEQSAKTPIIEGIMSCRGCPGILKLPGVEVKSVSRRARAGSAKARRGKGRPSARSQLHYTMKKRLAKANSEADAAE